MTASALNIASIAPAAKAGAGTGAQGTAASGLAGFEALLGALFPQADPTALVGAQAGANPLVSGAVVADTKATGETKDTADAEGDGKADAATDAAAAAGQPTAGDAAAALAASLAAAQSSTVEVEPTVAKTGAGDAVQSDKNNAAPPAWGRDKAKGVPAQPAILGANPKANLAGKAELAAESSDPAVEAEPAAAEAALTNLTAPETKTSPVATPRPRRSRPRPRPRPSRPARRPRPKR